jgi:membrane protein YqaA with SNARE-associated domain
MRSLLFLHNVCYYSLILWSFLSALQVNLPSELSFEPMLKRAVRDKHPSPILRGEQNKKKGKTLKTI